MSDNGTSRSAPRRGALLWLVGRRRGKCVGASAPTERDVEDAVPYRAGRRGAGHTKGIKREAPAGASQLVKKVRTDFFDKLRQNRKIKNSILFCDFGRCGG